MALALILDMLLLAISLLVIPLGLWLGARRQVHIGAGILLAHALISTLAQAWGNHLADIFDTNVQRTSFAAAVLFLFAGTMVGALVAIALEPNPPTADSQIIGGVLAWANGILFLSVGLHAFDQLWAPAARPSVLEKGILAKFLAVHLGWVLVVIAIAAVALSLAALVVRYQLRWQERTAAQLGQGFPPRVDPAGQAGPAMPRDIRPVRIPHNADAGKVEPDRRRTRPWSAWSGSERHRVNPRAESFQETLADSLPLRAPATPPRQDRPHAVRDAGQSAGRRPTDTVRPSGQDLSSWLRYAAGMAGPSAHPDGPDHPPSAAASEMNRSGDEPDDDSPPPGRQARFS